MENDVERVLIAEEVIDKRLDVLARRIEDEFPGEVIQVIILLKGALVFAADLTRRLPRMLEIECLNVSSYHGGLETSGKVDFLDHKLPDVKGRQVLVVDDILDTGLTLAAVVEKLRSEGASKVKTCVLLAKDKQRSAEVEADYVGFVIGDEFVIGYGLDYQGRYRNLPYVGTLKSEAI